MRLSPTRCRQSASRRRIAYRRRVLDDAPPSGLQKPFGTAKGRASDDDSRCTKRFDLGYADPPLRPERRSELRVADLRTDNPRCHAISLSARGCGNRLALDAAGRTLRYRNMNPKAGDSNGHHRRCNPRRHTDGGRHHSGGWCAQRRCYQRHRGWRSRDGSRSAKWSERRQPLHTGGVVDAGCGRSRRLSRVAAARGGRRNGPVGASIQST
jgi:hypothetical protein